MAGKPRGTPPPPHGTRRRYEHHIRYSDSPCAPCSKANADYHRQRRARHPKPGPVTIAVYPGIGPLARLLLGNELGWDGQPPYGLRREYLAECDAP